MFTFVSERSKIAIRPFGKSCALVFIVIMSATSRADIAKK